MVARPVWDDISVLRAESSAIADNLAQLKEVEALRDQLLNTYNAISKDDLARLNEFLPGKPNTEDVLVSMENLTRARGIQLKSINFSVSQDNALQNPAAATLSTASSAVTYNFAVSASYEAFRSLIDAFEKNARLTDVSEVMFSSGEKDVYSFSLKARSYYQK